MMTPQPFIIAEIGVNHNGSVAMARQLIDASQAAGADAVKFQTYQADLLAAGNPEKVDYQLKNEKSTRSHFEMLRSLQLSKDDHLELFSYCQSVGVEFLSTPYDPESARFLAELGVGRIKTASADVIDIPLHETISALGLDVIISTGMATLGEIEECIDLYKDSSCGIILMHCTSNYPCSDQSANLSVLTTLSQCFGLSVGYSDHSSDGLAAVLAATLGATVIERHVTLSRDLEGPDHAASMEMAEFSRYCSSLRRVQSLLGSSRKGVQAEELSMRNHSRKSATLAVSMNAGQRLERNHLIMSRPGTGLSWREVQCLIGRHVRVNLSHGHQVQWNDFVP